MEDCLGTGTVTRDVALDVLSASGVTCRVEFDKQLDDEVYVLVKDDVAYAYAFPEVLPRHLIDTLHRLFKIPKEYFYHPEMILEGMIPSQSLSKH